MPDRILTLRDLNRATLARQMLLERQSLSVPAAIEKLVGLQAQLAVSPYIGLWTRLQNFQREHLADFIDNHAIIKATLMRSTLHLFTVDDYLRFRATLQRVMTEASESITRRRGQDFDIEQVVEKARAFIEEQPRSFAEISAMLTEFMPDTDVGSMRYSVRTHLPMVQVPNDSLWSYPGNPKFTLAESWLKQDIPSEDHFRELVFRYLAAFGPATVADIQTWSGLSKLKDAVEKLKPELVVYRDERKRELLDLPDMRLPDGDTPAPERFLPEYDNLLLSHKDRTRVIADQYRSQVYLPGLRVRSTILVDGFVRGGWKISKSKGTAILSIEPFADLTKSNREALESEGEKLARFVEPDAKTYEIQFIDVSR